MMTPSLLTGPYFRANDEPIKNLVIFIHGYGATGDNLLSIGYEWLDALPHTLFMAPHAPFPCEESSLGRQWFSLRNWSTANLLKGTDAALPYLQDYIEHQQTQYQVANDRTFLVGFSQGAMLAIHMSLSSVKPLGGVLAYSGACLWPENRPCANQTPILLVHGRQDNVVPIEAFYHAKNTLKTLNTLCDAHELNNLAHNIDDRGIKLGHQFLSKNGKI